MVWNRFPPPRNCLRPLIREWDLISSSQWAPTSRKQCLPAQSEALLLTHGECIYSPWQHGVIKQKSSDAETHATLQNTVGVTGNKSLSELDALFLAYEMRNTLPTFPISLTEVISALLASGL